MKTTTAHQHPRNKLLAHAKGRGQHCKEGRFFTKLLLLLLLLLLYWCWACVVAPMYHLIEMGAHLFLHFMLTSRIKVLMHCCCFWALSAIHRQPHSSPNYSNGKTFIHDSRTINPK